MELTKGQTLALEAIESLQKEFPDGGGLCVISGYAGTGKSTMLRVLAEEEELVVLAPTGKAALRVKEAAGVKNSSTIHRWLYKPSENEKTGEMFYSPKDAGEFELPQNKTIFIDEASMVTEKMFRDLWRAATLCGLNLVFIGDSFQLPPVEKELNKKDFSVFRIDAHFRVDMTEVVRQALDSPIIRASMEIRDFSSNLECLGREIPCILERDLISHAVKTFENGGAIICHKNATRQLINSKVRESLNKDPERAEKGEPLLVLFNNYTIEVYNGELVTLDTTPQLLVPKMIPVRDRITNVSMNMFYYQSSIRTAFGVQKVIFADKELFGKSAEISMKAIRHTGQDISVNLKVKEISEASGGYVSNYEKKMIKPDAVLNANFGYALTVHKAQGSQWPTVFVLLENTIKPFTDFGRRFIYTAITRAVSEVKVCWY
jgi:exodeoxyribonuclease-5